MIKFSEKQLKIPQM